MTPAVLVLALALLAHPMTIKVWGGYVHTAPATLRVQVWIEAPADSDRVLRIVADDGDFYTQSARDLDGANSPRLSAPVDFRDVPAGSYEIRATVESWTQRVRAAAFAHVEVR